MAAKRGKSQAKRNNGGGGGGGGGMPGWAWLVIGLALGVGVFLLRPDLFKGGATDFFRATPKTDAPEAAAAKDDDAPIVSEGAEPQAGTPRTAPAHDAPKDPEYDFYTMLPGNETPLTDRELAERTRAEAADRPPTETPKPAPANPDAADPATPPQAIDAPATAPVAQAPAKPPKPAAGNPPPAAIDAPAASSRNDARYLLQAGAFAASGDAEALKAKIAFLGLSARVESGQADGKTVYRVRMGPYGTATELTEAKRKLSAGGLPAMAIKVK
ncbi:MAG: SPOR domain-containing protein [Lysobacteraceae bacterium]